MVQDDTLLEQSVMEQMNSTVSIYDGVTDGGDLYSFKTL